MKSFIVKLSVITLGIALTGWLVFSLFLPEYYLPVFPYLLLLVFLITIGIHAYQLHLIKKDIAKFTRSNMLITFIKLLFYSVVAVVYIALDSVNAIPFVICLMLLYLVYSYIEVAEITKIARKK